MTGIPILTTDRLVLRAPREADFPAFAAHYASPRAVWEDGPLDRAQAWKEFAAAAGLWHFKGYGSLSVEDRASGAYLGEVGIYQPAHYPEPDIGWMVLPESEGRGIAHEAALALRAWAYGRRGLPGLVSYIDPGNARSIRLAGRLGAVQDDCAALPEGEDCLVYRHPAPEACR